MKDKTIGELPSYVTGELTAEERAAIRAKAREQVESEIREKLMADALKEELAAERRRQSMLPAPGDPEPLMTVHLDLPENVAPWPALVIDGMAFYHGQTYKVGQKKGLTIKSMQAEAWKNQNRQEGHFVDLRRRPVTQIRGNSAGEMQA